VGIRLFLRSVIAIVVFVFVDTLTCKRPPDVKVSSAALRAVGPYESVLRSSLTTRSRAASDNVSATKIV
jgi:hypothetical protein